MHIYSDQSPGPEMTSNVLKTTFDNYRNVYCQTHTRGANIYKLAQHLFSNERIKNGLKIANVGSGPKDSTKAFMEAFLPFAEKIVLCEINPLFCNDYRQSTWYKDNTDKIDIHNCDMLNFNQHTKYCYLGSFDVIWCNHVMYYIDYNQFLSVICQLNKLLLKKEGYMMISVSNDDFYGPKFVHRKLKPDYVLSKYMDQLLHQIEEKYGCQWFVVMSHDKMPMTKDHAINLLKLFVKQNVYSRKQFHSTGVISENDEKMIEQAVMSSIDQIWFENCFMSVANHYFIKNFAQNNLKSNM